MIKQLAATPVGDVQAREPVRVKPTAPLIDAVALLKNRRRGAVLVEDDGGKLVGIFTEWDLITRLNHETHDWHAFPVGEWMTPEPKTLSRTDSIQDGIRLMQHGKFRNLPVVDDSGRAVGLITVRDILAHVAEHFPEEFLNLPPDPRHEASGRWGG